MENFPWRCARCRRVIAQPPEYAATRQLGRLEFSALARKRLLAYALEGLTGIDLSTPIVRTCYPCGRLVSAMLKRLEAQRYRRPRPWVIYFGVPWKHGDIDQDPLDALLGIGPDGEPLSDEDRLAAFPRSL